jgi:hypothetical protein
VAFRLTEEEYGELRKICDERGGRSISGFARCEPTALPRCAGEAVTEGVLESRLEVLEKDIADLKNRLEMLEAK